jgi:hypothetical protein
MQDHNGRLYLGTYNASIGWRTDPTYGPLLLHNMGAHLYQTGDGWYYSTITTNGFANPADPQGGRFDYGIRTMVSRPQGLFVGTANDYYGLMVFRATPGAAPVLQAPARLEIEPKVGGGALLSWETVPGATRYQIWRAPMKAVLIRDNFNPEGWNLDIGLKIPDTYVGPYQQVGVSSENVYVDATIVANERYTYHVIAENGTGGVSEQSNLVLFPLLTPPLSFTQLLVDVDEIARRQRFLAGQATPTRTAISQALVAANQCQIDTAISQLGALRTAVLAGTVALAPEATDLEIMLGKMIRRLQLIKRFPQGLSSNEFCTGTQVTNLIPPRIRLLIPLAKALK